jgi:adenylate cyclase
MGVEIERKFLVTGDGWRHSADGGTPLEQGYLSTDPERVVRVRIAGHKAYLTIKGRGPTPDVRPEFEYPIPVTEAREMLDLCTGTVLRKTRYCLPVRDLTWEIDVFGGAHEGLVLAEIELPAADTPFDRPDWVGEDVTAEGRYTNAQLSVSE